MLAIFSATYTPLKDWNIKANISAYTHDQTTKDRVKTYYLYDAEGNVAKTENLVSSLKDSNAYQYRTQLQFTSDYALTLADSHHFKFFGWLFPRIFQAGRIFGLPEIICRLMILMYWG